MTLFKKKKDIKTVCMLDVGSGSIGVAIVNIHEGGKPELIYGARKDIPIKKIRSFGGFVNALLSTTEGVLKGVPNKYVKDVEEVKCFLASPWYASETRKIQEKYKNEKKITPKYVKSIIEKVTDEFAEYSGDKYKKFLGGKVEIMEVQSTQIKLNGYETGDPYGKSVKQLDVSIFLSVSSSLVLKSLREMVERIFGVKKVTIHSFSLVLFTVLRDMFSDIDNFTYIDVSGEMTDVGFVRNDTVEKIAMFPKGGNYVWRSCAKKWKTTELEARSQSKVYFRGKATLAVEKKVAAHLEVVRKEWEDEFVENVNGVLGGKSMPKNIFLIADSDVRYWFATVLKEGKSIRSLTSGFTPDLIILNSKLLNSFCLFDVKDMKDPFLLLEAIFINKNRFDL